MTARIEQRRPVWARGLWAVLLLAALLQALSPIGSALVMADRSAAADASAPLCLAARPPQPAPSDGPPADPFDESCPACLAFAAVQTLLPGGFGPAPGPNGHGRRVRRAPSRRAVPRPVAHRPRARGPPERTQPVRAPARPP
ncbi:DUF2946 family protein [Azospirillum griseum]|uniref:DUF2946 domain-containing protein n=1 Tax=Azospirillum griseum TaxID=2496639 RepID=A0A3S0K434_9PROT|nr:DUF2946 family protein [Azospirillum griseum]RTR18911.1 hypothetical protein EJ903_14850 [Azospirillum griseum]